MNFFLKKFLLLFLTNLHKVIKFVLVAEHFHILTNLSEGKSIFRFSAVQTKRTKLIDNFNIKFARFPDGRIVTVINQNDLRTNRKNIITTDKVVDDELSGDKRLFVEILNDKANRIVGELTTNFLDGQNIIDQHRNRCDIPFFSNKLNDVVGQTATVIGRSNDGCSRVEFLKGGCDLIKVHSFTSRVNCYSLNITNKLMIVNKLIAKISNFLFTLSFFIKHTVDIGIFI